MNKGSEPQKSPAEQLLDRAFFIPGNFGHRLASA